MNVSSHSVFSLASQAVLRCEFMEAFELFRRLTTEAIIPANYGLLLTVRMCPRLATEKEAMKYQNIAQDSEAQVQAKAFFDQFGDEDDLVLAWIKGMWKLKDDPLKAKSLFKYCADKGFAPGECSYAWCIHKESSKEAVGLYELSAKKGYCVSQSNLGICYEFGDGAKKDGKAAAKWYEAAANQGYAPAIRNLGRLHELGVGVSKNIKTALKLYQEAAERGMPVDKDIFRCQKKGGKKYSSGPSQQQQYASSEVWFDTEDSVEVSFASGDISPAVIGSEEDTMPMWIQGDTTTFAAS